MQKQKTISNSNSTSILGIPNTDSRHNGKCNICAFHEEIRAFEDWIFVRLSRLVLASEWTINRKKFIFQSIDFDRFMTSEGSYTLILPSTSKTGQSVVQNRQRFFLIWVLLVKREYILAFYRLNFRLQTYRVLEIELNEQEFLPLFIDFYLGIPDIDSRHPRYSL